jgi:FkbM family methyltransferase
MNIIIRAISKMLYKLGGDFSFSQSGEDSIVDFIFRVLRVDCPTYLDIGASDPRKFSNTFSFYIKGSRGVLVEPDPVCYQRLVRERPGDVVLNAGVAGFEEEARPFFMMSTPSLNTFSHTEARRYEQTGLHKIVRVEKLPVISIRRIINERFDGNPPDFLTLDVEGLDLEIIKSMDLRKDRPTVICVETITFSETRRGEKVQEIVDFLLGYGYLMYADTYINTIFVDAGKWDSHP